MEPSRIPNDSAIVANGLIEASRFLGITQDQLASAIGVSRATVARIKKSASSNLDDAALASNGKPFELSLLLIRVYRSLYSILGGNQQAMKHWMSTPNLHLSNTKPVDLVQTALGLGQIIWYLDAMRGKI
ncbi:antitoxin Xre/MbcA/ParS toxin-binding domain-containing protein [Teredinibacter haidensis]|uniref:antitoxin Xre/MbcA/ParS toxin-binding domain-containing protein n=1 Tax=Teredinibacter haidensis TaxID=2731755 RepID=UPI000948B697|nr:antitoxin Xre/MbcA/ParS toxin-binding domain-containing protein [Teredinibacter haidensis]